jgi:hypothetical protein
MWCVIGLDGDPLMSFSHAGWLQAAGWATSQGGEFDVVFVASAA